MPFEPNRLCFDMLACQTANSRHRGIANYSLGLVRALASLSGETQSFLVAKRDPDSVAEIHRYFEGYIPAHRIKTVDLPSRPSFELAHNSPVAAMQAVTLARAYARLNPDVLHIPSFFEPDVSFPHPFECSGRVKSATVHDVIPYVFSERYLTKPDVRDWYYSKLSRLKHFDLLLANSEASRRDTIRYADVDPENIVTIMGACSQVFTPGNDPKKNLEVRQRFNLDKPFLMYTGGIDWRKNIEGAIQAYAKLPPATRSKHCFAIVCRIAPDERQQLTALMEKVGLRKNEVILTGFVSEEDLVALYRSCHAFIFPSIYEGFGLPPLEAISCGAPVILANNSSLVEIVNRPDAQFNALSQEEMTSKMNEVLTNPDYRRSLIKTGLARAADLTWERSAKIAAEAWSETLKRKERQLSNQATFLFSGPKPRMAYVSPLPLQQTGIANFSSELVQELAAYYDIELFTTGDKVEDPWLTSNHRIYSVHELDRRGEQFDIILYQVGNSHFHASMFDLMARWPGVVELHDFFLSGVINQKGTDQFKEALLFTHGPQAIEDPINGENINSLIKHYPANRCIFEHALGVIVHSSFAQNLIESHYPEGIPSPVKVIPHLRKAPPQGDPERRRDECRKKLGIATDEFVISSFGHVAPPKYPDVIVDAYSQFSAGRTHLSVRLVFVGNADDSSSNRQLREQIRKSGHMSEITITGYASQEDYQDWLMASDVSVQLRRDSRGETSGAVLDCMAHGVPLILNRYGEFGEYPENTVLFIPEIPDAASLAQALRSLADQPEKRRQLRLDAHAHVLSHHHPRLLAKDYFQTLQHFLSESWPRNPRNFIARVKTTEATDNQLHPWLEKLAQSDVVPRLPRTYLEVAQNSAEDEKWTFQTYRRLRSEGREVWPTFHEWGTGVLRAGHLSSPHAESFSRTETRVHLQHGDVLVIKSEGRADQALATNLLAAGVTIQISTSTKTSEKTISNHSPRMENHPLH